MNEQNNVVLIPLTRGLFAIVDAEYANAVKCYKWYADSRENYAVRRHGKKRIFMHRYIWEQVVGDIPHGKELDHINGNACDNRISNLRIVTHRENTYNRSERREGKTSSKLVGATWIKKEGRWRAQITINGRVTPLGRFNTDEEAHEAYKKALAQIQVGGKNEGSNI